MKQNIVVEDLNQLTDSQRKRLNELWRPAPFERAVAYICRNVLEDEYEAHEFIIGGLAPRGTNLMILDLKAVMAGAQGTPEQNGETVEAEPEDEEQPFDDDSYDEEDAEGDELPEGYDTVTFDAFYKEDCLPLFSLGQLIEVAGQLGYGDGQFYLGVEMEDSSWVDRDVPATYGDAEYREEELIDALWAAVLELL